MSDWFGSEARLPGFAQLTWTPWFREIMPAVSILSAGWLRVAQGQNARGSPVPDRLDAGRSDNRQEDSIVRCLESAAWMTHGRDGPSVRCETAWSWDLARMIKQWSGLVDRMSAALLCNTYSPSGTNGQGPAFWFVSSMRIRVF